MALALAAKYVQGILQVALTILGVVGGPLLGLFSLGMFTETANQGGAIIGFLTSLVFSITMGFGWPKPKVQNLPVYTDGCSNGTFVSNFSAEKYVSSSHLIHFLITHCNFQRRPVVLLLSVPHILHVVLPFELRLLLRLRMDRELDVGHLF